MRSMRAIIAILIAVSLTLAPIASAQAATRLGAYAEMSSSAGAASGAMSECHKAMKPAVSKDCLCCDTQSKAPCADDGPCLAKCSAQLLAVLVPSGECRREGMHQVWWSMLERPPDWSLRPPAPPPRA